ncbi:hypothetical protein BDN67DRAFT_975643 [Paxillus ammoniavirescens]|nr:hypothetical protein BDN67DRAFT_975643 [Paxillus ammoniavirescens]
MRRHWTEGGGDLPLQLAKPNFIHGGRANSKDVEEKQETLMDTRLLVHTDTYPSQAIPHILLIIRRVGLSGCRPAELGILLRSIQMHLQEARLHREYEPKATSNHHRICGNCQSGCLVHGHDGLGKNERTKMRYERQYLH